MDSLTHLIIGNTLAVIMGHSPSLTDPVYLSIIIGSQAPDLDLITRSKGAFNYLRQHRSFSHSLPGSLLWSALTTIILWCFFPQSSLLLIAAGAWCGCISHIAIDYFNTHGVAILWPFDKRRKSFPLLNVCDPIFTLLLLSCYLINFSLSVFSVANLFAILCYLGFRLHLRNRSTNWVQSFFSASKITDINLMPSLKNIFQWDFIVKTDVKYYVGRINAFRPLLTIEHELPKGRSIKHLPEKFKSLTLLNFFHIFTPYLYSSAHHEKNAVTLHLYDLRYMHNNQFLHSGTITIDEDCWSTTAYLYSHGHTVEITSL